MKTQLVRVAALAAALLPHLVEAAPLSPKERAHVLALFISKVMDKRY